MSAAEEDARAAAYQDEQVARHEAFVARAALLAGDPDAYAALFAKFRPLIGPVDRPPGPDDRWGWH